MATTGEQPSVEIPLDGHVRRGRGQEALFEGDFAPVSYTHLTLPTILLV